MANISTMPPATTPAQPSGYYGDFDDVIDASSRRNVTAYSNLDGKKNTLDTARIQRIMDQVDERVTTFLRINGIAKPEKTSDGFSLLTDGWALMVLSKLYRSRGDTDSDKPTAASKNVVTWHQDGVTILQQYVMAIRAATLPTQIQIGTTA